MSRSRARLSTRSTRPSRIKTDTSIRKPVRRSAIGLAVLRDDGGALVDQIAARAAAAVPDRPHRPPPDPHSAFPAGEGSIFLARPSCKDHEGLAKPISDGIRTPNDGRREPVQETCRTGSAVPAAGRLPVLRAHRGCPSPGLHRCEPATIGTDRLTAGDVTPWRKTHCRET